MISNGKEVRLYMLYAERKHLHLNSHKLSLLHLVESCRLPVGKELSRKTSQNLRLVELSCDTHTVGCSTSLVTKSLLNNTGSQ